MAKQGKPPTAAQFEQWLRTGDALLRVPVEWPARTKRAWIVSRIADGSLIALARNATVQDRCGIQSYTMTAIDPQLWNDPWVSRDRDFWLTGDIGFDDTPPIELMFTVEPKDDRPSTIVVFKDVRIEPASFEREVAAYLPPPVDSDTEPSVDDERPTVNRAALQQWHDLFAQLHPGAVEDQALKSAKAMFPDHRVPRQWVRDLRGSQKRGKPPKRS